MLSLLCLRSLPLAAKLKTLQLQNYLLKKKKSVQSCIFPPHSDLMIKQIPRRQMRYDNKYNGLEYSTEI